MRDQIVYLIQGPLPSSAPEVFDTLYGAQRHVNQNWNVKRWEKNRGGIYAVVGNGNDVITITPLAIEE